MPSFYGEDNYHGWANYGSGNVWGPPSMQIDLTLQGPFSIEEGYQRWILGGREVAVKYQGQEVSMPPPFSPKGITLEMFEKRVQREIKQT
jgi:hypothetical protein